MLELLLCFTLALGIMRAARAKHAPAFLFGSLVAYLLIADLLGALAATGDPQPIYTFFNYLFLGPGTATTRHVAALPLPVGLMDYPLVARAVRVVVSWSIAWRCFAIPAAFRADTSPSRAVAAIIAGKPGAQRVTGAYSRLSGCVEALT